MNHCVRPPVENELFFLGKSFISIKDIIRGRRLNPDLLASTMKPIRPAREKLRSKTIKSHRFGFQIQEFRVCPVWVSWKSTEFSRRWPAGAKYIVFAPFTFRFDPSRSERIITNIVLFDRSHYPSWQVWVASWQPKIGICNTSGIQRNKKNKSKDQNEYMPCPNCL